MPIDDARVQSELTRYLSDNWAPIIEKDVDGPNSLPLKIDAEQPNLGQLHATRRVARTIYLGSAPSAGAAHRGLEDRRVTLGCVMGYWGGAFDLLFQRIIEIWSNMPLLYVIIIISSVVAPSFAILLLIMACFGWVSRTWIMRTVTYKEKARAYVDAARVKAAGWPEE